MLHPLRVESKNPSEEDSSDSGSELGLEPETDRFGFFLTDGSTDGNRQAGPSPALVRQREAKWINIIDQWDQLLHKKASKVKMQCQKGIPASLRAKCWPLLSGATDKMKQQTDLYKSLDSQPALKHWVDVIERDLDRQFPFHEMFVSKDGHGQRTLFQVLKAYTQFKPEEGYCQAQGPVAAVLLMNMPAEEAFWCLVQICELYLPGYYSPLLEGVLFDAAILTWVLKRSCPAAHKHLQRHGVEPLMFATDWLMCLFTRHLPFNTLLRVWDLFFCHGVRVLLQVAVVMVQRVLGREDQRKRCCGQMETLQTLRDIKTEVKDEEDDFIVEVLSVPLSARDLQRQTEKELQRWKKERPSSTFDPRGRCLGYHMAWLRSQQCNEECERKEREKGNLSVTLFRSASTLSLTRSKWQKGVKANSRERKSNVKVVRHLSMGAKEDCQSWANLNNNKFESLQDDSGLLLEKNKRSDPRLKPETQQIELLEESDHQQKDVPQITDNFPTEQIKEKSESSVDASKQEGNSESNLAPVQDNFVSILQRKTQLSQITTDTHIQPRVEFMSVTNLYQAKSLKLLATQAARTLDFNRDNSKNLNNSAETKKQNDVTYKYQEKVSCSGGCHLTRKEMKESHNQSDLELCEPAAQEKIQDANVNGNEQVNVGVIQIQTHLSNTDEKKCTHFRNDVQPTNQYISVEDMLVSEGTKAGQKADSENSTKTCDQTEDTTYCQERQDTSILPTEVNLNTADASIDIKNIKQNAPERDTQSDVCQTRNSSTFEQIGYDFTSTNQQHIFSLSSGFRLRKSSNSRGSRLARRLSEDLFTTPKLLDQTIRRYTSQAESDEATQISNSSETEEVATQKEQQPRRFALFRRLREDKNNKKQSKPKVQVPRIMIQDFSDHREIGHGAEEDKKMSSREKRRQRKQQKRKEKEVERQRKTEKEMKEGNRDQDKGTSAHPHSQKGVVGSAASQSRHETPYAEMYF